MLPIVSIVKKYQIFGFRWGQVTTNYDCVDYKWVVWSPNGQELAYGKFLQSGVTVSPWFDVPGWGGHSTELKQHEFYLAVNNLEGNDERILKEVELPLGQFTGYSHLGGGIQWRDDGIHLSLGIPDLRKHSTSWLVKHTIVDPANGSSFDSGGDPLSYSCSTQFKNYAIVAYYGGIYLVDIENRPLTHDSVKLVVKYQKSPSQDYTDYHSLVGPSNYTSTVCE